MSKANESAFPITGEVPGDMPGIATTGMVGGLTKREYFAGLAMQGMLITDPNEGRMICDREAIHRLAVKQADALLAELAGRK
jgi:hypothetical protein